MEDIEVRLDVADILESFDYRSYYEKSIRKSFGIIEPEGIELNNKSKLITNEEIEDVIKLLHADYQKLNISIDIHGSRFHTLQNWMSPTNSKNMRRVLTEGIKKKAGGFQRGREVVIFSYIYKQKIKIKGFKLLVIQALIHEIRHVYQMEYMKKKYDKAHENYISSGEGYSTQWIERDANSFSQRMMNKNKEQINEILNIDFDWNCIWGSFNVK